MQNSDRPALIGTPFGQNAGGSYIRAIPDTTADPVAASFDKGFPPNTFLDQSAGGTPPDGRDFNGIFFQLSAWARWYASGGQNVYNADFSADIGGYPLNSVLASTTPGILWRSTANNNTTDPDGGSPANWQRVNAQVADLLTGTSNTQFVTPKSLKDAGLTFPTIAPVLNPSLWRRYNLDGTIEMGGVQNFSSFTEHVEDLYFPTPFPSSCIDVQLTVIGTGNYTGSTNAYQVQGTLTPNGCVVQVNSQATTFNDASGFRWRALGF